MQFTFLITHVGSGWQQLQKALNSYPHINCSNTNKVYRHPRDLDSLIESDPYAKIHIDIIEYNHSIASSSLYKCCDFIYFMRKPTGCSLDYYRYRLRRMYEMWHHAPGIFLDDFAKLQDFLKIGKLEEVISGGEFGEVYEKYLEKFINKV